VPCDATRTVPEKPAATSARSVLSIRDTTSADTPDWAARKAGAHRCKGAHAKSHLMLRQLNCPGIILPCGTTTLDCAAPRKGCTRRWTWSPISSLRAVPRRQLSGLLHGTRPTGRAGAPLPRPRIQRGG
jgi:hypothetical protein